MSANRGCLLFVRVGGLASPDPTGPAGSDKADLPTGARAPLDGRGLADVLVVAAAVGMLDGVHGDTAHLRGGRVIK